MTLTTPTWGQFVIIEPVENPPYPAAGKQGPHICIWGEGLQLSSAGTGPNNPHQGSLCKVYIICYAAQNVVNN